MGEVELGDKVKCTITGLIGIAASRCLYLHGCDHIGIQPPADNKTGRVPSIVWVDSPQVTVVKTRTIKVAKKSRASRGPGGPGAHPGERAHPNYDEGTFLNE